MLLNEFNIENKKFNSFQIIIRNYYKRRKLKSLMLGKVMDIKVIVLIIASIHIALFDACGVVRRSEHR